MKKGFTLLELLVVIAIIGILASVTLASVNNARDNAYESKVEQTLLSVEKAIKLYESDRGYLPKANLSYSNSNASEFYRVGTCSGSMSGFQAIAMDIQPDINEFLSSTELNLNNGCVIYLLPLHSSSKSSVSTCKSDSDIKPEFCDQEYVIMHIVDEFGAPYTGSSGDICPTANVPNDEAQTYNEIGYMCIN